MNGIDRRRLNSTPPEKDAVSLDNAKPRPRFAFARRTMPYYKSVSDLCCFKIQIPAEIFLARFIIRFETLFAQFVDQPLRQVITEAAGIDEIIFGLGHVKCRAFKRDHRSDLRVHRSHSNSNSSKGPGG